MGIPSSLLLITGGASLGAPWEAAGALQPPTPAHDPRLSCGGVPGQARGHPSSPGRLRLCCHLLVRERVPPAAGSSPGVGKDVRRPRAGLDAAAGDVTPAAPVPGQPRPAGSGARTGDSPSASPLIPRCDPQRAPGASGRLSAGAEVALPGPLWWPHRPGGCGAGAGEWARERLDAGLRGPRGDTSSRPSSCGIPGTSPWVCGPRASPGWPPGPAGYKAPLLGLRGGRFVVCVYMSVYVCVSVYVCPYTRVYVHMRVCVCTGQPPRDVHVNPGPYFPPELEGTDGSAAGEALGQAERWRRGQTCGTSWSSAAWSRRTQAPSTKRISSTRIR